MNILHRGKVLLAVLMAATLAPASIVIAQESEAVDEDKIEEIVVTGSRIKRAGVDTFYPAITVTSAELDDGAFSNLADALNQVPSFGNPDATPLGGQNAFSVGQNFVDFLGLGSQRTLTLINGRRFVSSNTPSIFGESGGLQVDYNVIPVALVDRIETIGVGGAPIYGSDAIAGTINVILKDRFEGLEINAQAGETSAGDAQFQSMSVVAGANFSNGRGNVTMSAEAYRQEGLARNERPRYTENDPFFADKEDRDPNDPDSDQVRRIYYDQRVQLFAQGGSIDGGTGLFIPTRGPGSIWGDLPDGVFYQFDENSNLVPFIAGQSCPGSVFFACRGQDPNGPDHDGPDFFDNVAQIQSPLERKVFSASVNYDIAKDVTFFSDVLFSSSWADELFNQGGFQTFAFGGTSGSLVMPADHPLLSQQARELLAANDLTSFGLHRFNNDIIDSSNERTQFLWRATAGLEGSFAIGNKDFFWDVHTAYGSSNGQTRADGIIDDRFLNALEVRQLSAADFTIDPDTPEDPSDDFSITDQDILAFSGTTSAGVGDIVCESVYQAAIGNLSGTSGSGVTDSDLPFVQGCVPLNLFGLGVRSDAAKDWVTGNQMTQSEISQQIFGANFGGDLFTLPAGPIGFNVGFEARQETAAFIPGTGTSLGISRSSPFDETGGEYKTKEFYGEVMIPLVNPDMEVPWLALAEINSAVREIDNSLAGSANVWTVGARIAPVRDITFRGNYTESIRAPSLVELFAPQAQVFEFADDPCDYRFVTDGPVPATRQANCEAELGANYDPATFTSNIANATAIGRSGGNPDLKNESAESYSIGLTFEPRWVEGLLFTADFISIELTDAIQEVGIESLMESCYDSSSFPVSSCDSFVRDAGGQVIDFTMGQTNAALFDYESVGYGAYYEFEVASFLGLLSDRWATRSLGDFNVNARLQNSRKRRISVVGEPNDNTIGGFSDPEWSGTFDFVWTGEKTRIFWRLLWQEDALLDASGNSSFEHPNGNLIRKTDARYISNVSVSYSLDSLFAGAPDNAVVQLNIGNLFDREPDLIQEAAGHYGSSELFGRTYNVSVRGSW